MPLRADALNRTILITALLLVSALAATGTGAQQRAQSAGAEYVYEVHTSARWLHGRQQPRFTRFLDGTAWIRLESMQTDPGAGERSMVLVLGRRPGGDTVRVRFDGRGQVSAVDVATASPPPLPIQRPGSAERLARMRLQLGSGPGAHVRLPELLVRALVPHVPVAALARGAQWRDTFDIAYARDGFRQRMRGERVSRVVGDTSLDGRTMWIIADSARVRYQERQLDESRTLDTLVVVTRTAAGAIHGRHVYDPASGLDRVRHDTTALAGVAELHYPDGRSFRTPARYARTRTIERHSPSAYAARLEELRVEHEARSGGMVMLPANPLEERLAARDTMLRDSLLSVWSTSEDPATRARLRSLLLRHGQWDDDFAKRLRRLGIAAGDTAWLASELTDRLYDAEPFDLNVLRAALPFMADPGLAFAFGVDSDPFFENPRQALLLSPPAVIADSAEWPCTPEACRLLAAQTNAAEPRLRALARLAQFVLDPVPHAAEIEAAVARGERFLLPALAMMQGYLLNWPGSDARHPLPAPAADWRAWIHWMNPLPPWFPDSLNLVAPRIGIGLHGVRTIRMHELVSGRDVTGELRARLASAESDSARLLFGAMLLELEPAAPDPQEISANLRSASEADRVLARRQLSELMHEAEPWTSESASMLMERLLAILVEGAQSWPELHPGGPPALTRIASGGHRPEEAPLFLLRDSVAPAVAEAWRGRATLISADEWRRRPSRHAGMLFRPAAVRRFRPFVRLAVAYQSRYPREAGQAPRAYAGIVTVTLMQTAQGWVIVEVGGGVT